MAPDASERALKMNRQECRKACDIYLSCMDENNWEDERKCRVELKVFKNACPSSWVGHFIRKHKFDRFRQINKDTEGFATLDDKYLDPRTAK